MQNHCHPNAKYALFVDDLATRQVLQHLNACKRINAIMCSFASIVAIQNKSDKINIADVSKILRIIKIHKINIPRVGDRCHLITGVAGLELKILLAVNAKNLYIDQNSNVKIVIHI